MDNILFPFSRLTLSTFFLSPLLALPAQSKSHGKHLATLGLRFALCEPLDKHGARRSGPRSSGSYLP